MSKEQELARTAQWRIYRNTYDPHDPSPVYRLVWVLTAPTGAAEKFWIQTVCAKTHEPLHTRKVTL